MSILIYSRLVRLGREAAIESPLAEDALAAAPPQCRPLLML